MCKSEIIELKTTERQKLKTPENCEIIQVDSINENKNNGRKRKISQKVAQKLVQCSNDISKVDNPRIVYEEPHNLIPLKSYDQSSFKKGKYFPKNDCNYSNTNNRLFQKLI